MRTSSAFFVLALAGALSTSQPAHACTGITLASQDSTTIVARTIEWGGSDLNSQYVIVPRGYTQRSYIPGGGKGMAFTARYGYAGLAVEQKDFVAEGVNEAGLSAGLFYFPNYGQYEAYDERRKNSSIADLQLVSLILGECATLDEVKEKVNETHVIAIDPRASTVHWRFTDAEGKQLVLEIVDGKANFYENPLGVLTNSPGLEWQLTNLNNYVNLFPGSAPAQKLGSAKLASFGAGSGFLGIPGDVTPPSRFVRAAFYQATAPRQATAEKTVLQAFQILNNFDIPVGVEFEAGKIPADIPSATQWTSATDMKHRVIYFRTMYNSEIRSIRLSDIDFIYFRTMYNSEIRSIRLSDIDFSKVAYQAVPLDEVKSQPIRALPIR